MKKILILLWLIALADIASAQTNFTALLWPDKTPGAHGDTPKDIPTISAYFPNPTNATGAAMVIFPGGGYGSLSGFEGKDYALWFKDNGVAGFVVKYRLGSAGYRYPVMLWDAARAVRFVRANATNWNIDPKHIGVIGSSAGGHMASLVLTHYDQGNPDAIDPVERVSSRPDLGIICYGVITMGEGAHAGSRRNLLGDDPSAELIEETSNEKHVTKDTPPCFLWSTAFDKEVLVTPNTLAFALALSREHVPFDLHIYEKGKHALALSGFPGSPYIPDKLHPWTRDCLYWLRTRNFVK